MLKNVKINILEKNLVKLIIKVKYFMIFFGERKQCIIVGKIRSQNNNFVLKIIIIEGRIVNKIEFFNLLNGLK